MGDILLEWLNYHIKLSHPVTSIDKDFRNGYLLGEVLYIHNWQKDFPEFVNKHTPDARIKNFTLIEGTLRSLGIHFDSRVAADIMKGKPGVVGKILFQAKIKFDRLSRLAAPTSTRGESMEGIKPLPNLPQRGQKPIYNTMNHQHFDDAIRHIAGSSKELLELKALRRFYEEGRRQCEAMENYRDMTRTNFMLEVERTRQERLRHRREDQEFMRTWNEVNVMHWIHNQEVALSRRKLRRKVSRKLARERRLVRERERSKAIRSVRVDLEGFNPEAVLLEQTPCMSDTPSLQPEEAFRASMSEIKRRKEENQVLEALRESRRRKFLCEDEEAQVAIVSLALEEQLGQQCKADADLKTIWRTVAQNEHMFAENRSFREKQYAERQAQDAREIEETHQSYLQVLLSSYERDLRSQCLRYDEAMDARAAAQHTRITEFCAATVDRIVDLSLEAAAYRTYADYKSTESILPPVLWRDLKVVFHAPLPLLKPDQGLAPTEAWPPIEDKETAIYLSARAWPWAEKEEWEEEVAAEAGGSDGNGTEGSTNVLLSTPASQVLGEIVIECSLAADPLPPLPEPPALPRYDMCVAISGKTFSGKSRQAREAAKRFNLRVLSAHDLVMEAMAKADADGDAAATAEDEAALDPLEVENSRLGRIAKDKLAQGGTVPDEVMTALIALAIKKLGIESPPESGDIRGWVVEDFPETAAQAILLEKELSGYDPAITHPTRWSRKSCLATCLPEPPPSTALIPSAIDLFFHLDTPREQALENAIAKRHDTTTGEDFQLLGVSGNRPPLGRLSNDALILPEDPTNPNETAGYRMASHDVEVADLHKFLSRFGRLVVVKTLDCDTAEVFATMEHSLHQLSEEKKQQRQAAAAAQAAAQAAAVAAAQAQAESAAATISEQQSVEEGSTTTAAAPTDAQTSASSSVSSSSASSSVPSTATTAATPASSATAGLQPPPRKSLSESLGSVMTRLWKASEEDFLASIRKIFWSLRSEDVAVANYIRAFRLTFKSFLKRPDDKQSVVSNFQQAFNAIELDMRFDEETKAELMLRDEELRDALWRIVEARRNEATLLLNSYRENGWLELKSSVLQTNLSMLAQLEVDRFHAGLHVVGDFFDATCGDPKHVEGTLTDITPPPTEPPKKGAATPAKKPGRDSGPAEPVVILRPLHAPNLGMEVGKEILAGAAAAAAALKAAEDAEGKSKQSSGKGKAAPAGKKGAAAPALFEEAPRPPIPSTHVVRPPTILQAVLASALAYADKWGPTGYPVQAAPATYSEGQIKALQARHAAVWHEAAQLRRRLERLQAAGARLEAELVKMASEAYQEVSGWVEQQSRMEEASVERLVAMVAQAVEEERALEFDMRFQCEVLTINKGLRHVPEAPPLPVPRLLPLDTHAFNEDQLDGIRGALLALAQAETPDYKDGSRSRLVVSKRGLMEALLRLSTADSELLPPDWAQEDAKPLTLAKALEGSQGEETVDVDTWLAGLAVAA